MILIKRLALLLLLIPIWAYAQGFELHVCRLADDMYQFSIVGDVDGWGFEDGSNYDLKAMTASGEGVRFFTWANGMTTSIYGYPDVDPCPKDEWHPGAPSILIPASAGVFKLEIQDAYGHWSLVTDAAHPEGIVLSPNGGSVELIGSVGQDIDPAHYRTIEVNP
jgi:hypothetical protein